MEENQGSQDSPGKKKREESREVGQIRWRLRPTFLDLGRNKILRKEEEKRGGSNGKEDKKVKPEKEGVREQEGQPPGKERKETESKPTYEPEKEVKEEPGPEREEEECAEETQHQVRTPVRERIRKLNKKAAASPGKFPLMKQQMLDIYFKKKSPKASKARERV